MISWEGVILVAIAAYVIGWMLGLHVGDMKGYARSRREEGEFARDNVEQLVRTHARGTIGAALERDAS